MPSIELVQDELRRQYEDSLRVVLPLKEQLGRTDRLIDQVVYRLYGLTQEEIEVVEGRAQFIAPPDCMPPQIAPPQIAPPQIAPPQIAPPQIAHRL